FGLEALVRSPEFLAFLLGEGHHGCPGIFEPVVFRFTGEERHGGKVPGGGADNDELAGGEALRLEPCLRTAAPVAAAELLRDDAFKARSEEHTSELQSQSNLVCRLLLEKKKNSN